MPRCPAIPGGEGFSTRDRLHFQEQSQNSPNRRGGHGDHRYPGQGRGVTFKVSNKVPSLSAAPGRGLRLDTRAWPELLSPGRGNARPASRPLACGLEGSPGQRLQAGRLWLGILGLAVGGQSGIQVPGDSFSSTKTRRHEAELGIVGVYALEVHRGRGHIHAPGWLGTERRS